MRLGLHVNKFDTNSKEDRLAREYVAAVRPPFVKALDEPLNREFLQFCRDHGCEVLGRIVFPEGQQGVEDHGPWRGHIDRIRDKALEFPEVTHWEFLNECHHKGDDMDRYAQCCITFMQAMEAIGRKAVVGSFSTGTPDEDQWVRFRPAVEHAWHNGHAIGVHQYASPDMRFMCGRNQWNGGNPTFDDTCTDPRVEGWHTLRHRKFLPIIRSWGVSARIVVTESGNDDIFQNDDHMKGFFGQDKNKKRGFRQWKDFGHKIGDYADQLRWYCWQLSQDPEVIGVVDFGFSANRDEWKPFDLTRDEEMLKAIQASQATLPRGGPEQSVSLVVAATAAPAASSWRPGDTLTTQVNVKLRRSPGFLNKPEEDELAVLRSGTNVSVLIGGPREANGLTWWPVRHRGEDGVPLEGYMAQRNRSGTLLLERSAPAPPFLPESRLRVILEGNLNMRRSPGFKGKVRAEDVITTVPGGSQLTVLAGPEVKDDLTWWQVRLNRSAIETHEGWVADGADDLPFLADVAFLPVEADARG